VHSHVDVGGSDRSLLLRLLRRHARTQQARRPPHPRPCLCDAGTICVHCGRRRGWMGLRCLGARCSRVAQGQAFCHLHLRIQRRYMGKYEGADGGQCRNCHRLPIVPLPLPSEPCVCPDQHTYLNTPAPLPCLPQQTWPTYVPASTHLPHLRACLATAPAWQRLSLTCNPPLAVAAN